MEAYKARRLLSWPIPICTKGEINDSPVPTKVFVMPSCAVFTLHPPPPVRPFHPPPRPYLPMTLLEDISWRVHIYGNWRVKDHEEVASWHQAVQLHTIMDDLHNTKGGREGEGWRVWRDLSPFRSESNVFWRCVKAAAAYLITQGIKVP